MQKLLLTALVAGLAVGASWGRGTTVNTGSGVYNVDTVFHAKVGPGTTQTSLHLTGPANLNVFYITVDQTTPGVSIRTLSGGDKVAGNGCTSTMARNHSHAGLHYFAGSNGDFYYTGGKATNGSSIVGTPINAFAADREMFRSSESWYQFSVDMEGVARICRLSFQKGTATCGDQSVAFKAINNDAANNGVTLYTSKFWGSTNQAGLAGNCAEVTARLVEGDNFWAGQSYRLEITSTSSSTGDLTIPANGFVLLGRGNAKAFVEGLQPGDIVTMDNVITTPDGTPIIPSCIVSGNPKNVGGGVNLNSEDERSDATQRHPRTGIGVSADGSKIVMMVVDGRGSSVGCTTGTLGDLLIFAGCAEGVNLDGGGSSTLYTEALGVRNHCSDGNERAVANSVYAVLEAPEDNEVAELAFYDYNPALPALGVYTPRVIAFNKYGLVINTDFKDFTLSCPEEMGSIINDGHSLFATGSGMHALTATCGDVSVSMPIEIETPSSVNLKVASVTIDETHSYPIGLYAMVNGSPVDLNPAALSWESADPTIAAIDDAGLLTAVANGSTTVTGTAPGISVTQQVIVQNHEDFTAPMVAADDFGSWRTSKSDVKDMTATAADGSVAVDFTISMTRGPKIGFNFTDLYTYGLPESIDITIDPANTVFSKIALSIQANNESVARSLDLTDLPANGEEFIARFAMDDFFTPGDITIFPLKLRSLTFNFGNAADEVCHFDVKSMLLNYDTTKGIRDVSVTNDGDIKVVVDGTTAYLSRPARNITVADLSGRIIAAGSGNSIELGSGHGVVILTADGNAVKVAY